MRYFFDTEFIEDGKTIDLISIGIVAEDGREYYAVSTEFDESKASDWVKENVLSQIPHQRARLKYMPHIGLPKADSLFRQLFPPEEPKPIDLENYYPHRTRKVIAEDILTFIGNDTKPTFWAYYADYDWVSLCQLYGTMMDLPKGWPMYCRDLKQIVDYLGGMRLPDQKESEHHALHDARWVKTAWDYVQSVTTFYTNSQLSLR